MTIANTTPREKTRADIDYITMSFLILTPIIGIAGTALYTYFQGFHLWMALLALAMYGAVGLSICAGYHRFFSHKSYEASAPVQIFYAVFGAMAAQNSILWWSSSHRVHHQHVDNDWDPYNIKRGFWWAHILWVFNRHDAPDAETNAQDLLKNPIVQWQNRWYRVLLIVGGFGLPTLIGAMFGDALAGLLWGGFLRLVVIHHTTFFVNSLAHYVGRRTYNAEVSARDNWGVALLTLGEGYHSFHHRFPADFRNGIRWYHWDPAKWFIASLRTMRMASELRSATPPQIEQARMHAELRKIEPRLAAAEGEIVEKIHRVIADARAHLDAALTLWRQHVEERSRNASSAWRRTRRTARQHIREARRSWRSARSMAVSWETVRS
ncbi:MAG TPA: fatty acid desaturase [Thermoanaerobaculia bacterium]|jgi:stearoyl-CoA desaturase (delta-9 desaturase)|nr:fatty acid desaturase [Thermoanaerobaculia bacterium]